MKATIKIKDRHKLKCAIHSTEMANVLWEIDHNFKKRMEYHLDGNEDLTGYDVLEKFMAMFREECGDELLGFIRNIE